MTPLSLAVPALSVNTCCFQPLLIHSRAHCSSANSLFTLSLVVSGEFLTAKLSDDLKVSHFLNQPAKFNIVHYLSRNTTSSLIVKYWYLHTWPPLPWSISVLFWVFFLIHLISWHKILMFNWILLIPVWATLYLHLYMLRVIVIHEVRLFPSPQPSTSHSSHLGNQLPPLAVSQVKSVVLSGQQYGSSGRVVLGSHAWQSHNSVPGAHMVERKNQLIQVILWWQHPCMHMLPHTTINLHTLDIYNNRLYLKRNL